MTNSAFVPPSSAHLCAPERVKIVPCALEHLALNKPLQQLKEVQWKKPGSERPRLARASLQQQPSWPGRFCVFGT